LSRFRVEVITEEALTAAEALREAGINTSGPSPVGFSDEDGWARGRILNAFLDAEGPEAAEARVREVVGDGCELTVESLGPT
jgi:hypothetical protein